MQTQLKKTSLQPKSGFDSLVAFNDFHTINALNDISLTKREVDVLTCLMHGKSNKSIAILLSMSPRTVGTHLRNLMGKFKCHSRENLIHFIEQSNQFILFKKYYTHLLIESSFRRCLHDIARLIQGNNVSCLIAYSSKIIEKRMIESLSDYLSLSGIKIRVLALEDPDLSKDHSFQLDCISNDIVIYLLTSTPNDALLTFLQKRTAQKPGSVVILTDGQNNIQMKPSMKSVCLSLQAIYYDNIFNIIEVLLPHSKFSLEQISSAFKKSIESMRTDSVDELSQYQDTATLSRPIWHSLSIVHMFTIIGGIASICALFFSIWFAYEPEVKNQKNNINIFPIRSDFSFPKKQSYIWRSDIFKLIEDNFNTQAHENIKSVVLIGLSGAGKTTLARHYAHLQKNAVVWELNAESKSLLMQSFFDLAYAFARTPQQKTEIAFIQEIKDASTREKQLLSFIKENLRKNKNWFLIYDNVEDISSIQSLFPQDHQTWGSGQALITTQNKTIQNSPYLNHSNIIKVEEFSKIDALTLLSKILYQKPLQQLSSNQTQNIEDFLKHIPLFPLDILLAASYIKNTHATLTQYIKNVDLHSNEFEAIQESLVKQLNQNSKTRYSVVSS